MNNLEFALEMKNKRLASGLSQGELASLTHVSRYSINRFENGKANASKETQNIILRCLNYYVCDKPFYLLVDYLSVRFPTTDELEVMTCLSSHCRVRSILTGTGFISKGKLSLEMNISHNG